MSEASRDKRIIVGMSGASGAVYGVRLLEVLGELGFETHLIMSQAARITLASESDLKPKDVEKLASVVHANTDVGASCASGSFKVRAMIIAPCSVKSLAEIASCAGLTLMSRTADVMLKERRRLVLMLRETPLNLLHIRHMAAVTEAGAIVYPPVPAFYARPATLQEMVDHSVGRVLDLLNIDNDLASRWTGVPCAKPRDAAQ